MFARIQQLLKENYDLKTAKALTYPTLNHFQNAYEALQASNTLREWLESGF